MMVWYLTKPRSEAGEEETSYNISYDDTTAVTTTTTTTTRKQTILAFQAVLRVRKKFVAWLYLLDGRLLEKDKSNIIFIHEKRVKKIIPIVFRNLIN